MVGYKEYKSSKLNWIDSIPSHWIESKINYLFSIGRGRVISNLELIPDGKYPVFSSQTKNDGCMGYIDTYDFDDDLLTWTTDGANAGTVFIRSGKFNCTNVCGTLKSKENLVLKYYLYYLQFVTQFYKRPDTNGAKIMNNEMAAIYAIKPSLEEQKKIAEYLDYKTATIDEIIAKKQKLIAALDEKKKSIINDIVTGKKVWNGSEFITPTQVKDSGIQWLGQIPEHWEVYKLKYLIQNISSGCSVNSEDSPITNDQEYGVLKTSCVYNYIFNSNENKKVLKEEYSRVKCPVKKNTIIVSRMNTPELVGASGYIDKDYNNLFLPDRLWQLNFKNDYYNSVRYISFILSSEIYRYQFGKISSGSSASMQNMSQSSFLNLEIVLPSENEIKSIEIELMKLFEILDLIKSKINTQIEKITEYRQAVIAEAVTGKIDVRHWTTPNN